MKANPIRRFRDASLRWKDWDYTNDGAYFITICTKEKIPWFGHIIGQQMKLNEIGSIAEHCWAAVPEHISCARLGAYVIMPDHMHGILIIDGERPNNTNFQKPVNDHPMALLSPQAGSVGSVIRSYKSAVTLNSRHIFSGFTWQSRYYDRVIRNQEEYWRIEKYIIDNPKNWGK